MTGDLYSKFKEQQEKEDKLEQQEFANNNQEIVLLGVDLLVENKKHIFSAIPKAKYEELKDSISRVGVLSPIIVRKIEDNKYEIISGHNRTRCSKELGITEIPAIIKDYDDEMSELIMIDTNLAQREKILPCEKGTAYKKKLELLKKLKKENRLKDSYINDLLENAPVGQEESSVEKLANESEDSKTNIQRFIRLTELNEDLKRKVNDEIIGVRAGVELSYIKPEEQIMVNDAIDENNLKLTTKQAQKLRAVYGTITPDNVLDIIKGKTEKKKIEKFTGKLLPNIFKKYKDKFANDKEFSELIDILLENHYKTMSDN